MRCSCGHEFEPVVEWQHKLLCGDSTRREDVERVMRNEYVDLVVTDPPYGVFYADKNKFLNAIGRPNRIDTPIEGDHQTCDQMGILWKTAFSFLNEYARDGCAFYTCAPQGGDLLMMMMAMRDAGFPPRHSLIWLKNNHVLGRADYAYKHEPILYAWKSGGHKFYGGFQTSILEFDKPFRSDLHPTTKPVKLFERLISNSSLLDEIVADTFVGSGTTIIACQSLGRRCRAIEISPAYVSVCLQRMSDAFSGITIERVEAA